MRDILVTGVSTRKYEKVLPEVAGTVGVSKSSVSRRMVEASAEQLRALNERSLKDLKLLAIYLDGIVVDAHHVVGAIGVDWAAWSSAGWIRSWCTCSSSTDPRRCARPSTRSSVSEPTSSAAERITPTSGLCRHGTAGRG
ncbi:MAG: transposase [Ideonella sp.]|nr:transposase [Ideonella sp.]